MKVFSASKVQTAPNSGLENPQRLCCPWSWHCRPQPSLHILGLSDLDKHLVHLQVRDLLAAYGRLRSFNLVVDHGTGASKGFAFCEYANPLDSDRAITNLTGTQVRGKSVVSHKAPVASVSTWVLWRVGLLPAGQYGEGQAD